jgi:hypothetical protein
VNSIKVVVTTSGESEKTARPEERKLRGASKDIAILNCCLKNPSFSIGGQSV